jgi:hypothetical protein
MDVGSTEHVGRIVESVLRDYGIFDAKRVSVTATDHGWNVVVVRTGGNKHVAVRPGSPASVRVEIIRRLGLAR